MFFFELASYGYLPLISFHRTLSFLVLWPMPMYGSKYVFSKSFFTGWVSVGMVWIFLSLFAVGVYPLWESRVTIAKVCTSMVKGRRPNTITQGESAMMEETSGTVTPVEKGETSSVK